MDQVVTITTHECVPDPSNYVDPNLDWSVEPTYNSIKLFVDL